MPELTEEQAVAAQLSVVTGKPIQLRPSAKLRHQLELESKAQSRSLNNLIIIILERYFKNKLKEAGHAR